MWNEIAAASSLSARVARFSRWKEAGEEEGELSAGEIYASAKSALIEDSHFERDTINDRLCAAFDLVRAGPVSSFWSRTDRPPIDRGHEWMQKKPLTKTPHTSAKRQRPCGSVHRGSSDMRRSLSRVGKSLGHGVNLNCL